MVDQILLDDPSDEQRELARLGRSAAYYATRAIADIDAFGSLGSETATLTGRRLVLLGARVAAYLSRTLSLTRASVPRYRLAADIASLWAPRGRRASAWTDSDKVRTAYLTLVAAVASDVVWTEWECVKARAELAVTLIGATEAASAGWGRLRDRGIGMADSASFDLASAADNAAFWPGLRDGFSESDLVELLSAVPAEAEPEEAAFGAPFVTNLVWTPAAEQIRSGDVPGPAYRKLAEPVHLSSTPTRAIDPSMQEARMEARDRRVRVWFATNRDRLSTGGFGITVSPDTSYGYVDLHVDSAADPDVRKTSTATDANLFLAEISGPTVFSAPDEFFDTLLRDTERVMLFVHGYNNSFDAAIQRAAQLAWDLDIDVPMVVFSWPSADKWHRYAYDRNSVDASVDPFTVFVERLSARADLDILVHSMGNRLLAHSALALSRAWSARTPIRTLALAAADLGVTAYRSVAPRYSRHMAGRAAVYVSNSDRALLFSRLVNQVPVLGHGGPGTTIPPIDAVDADRVNSLDFLRHSYFALSATVLTDLAHLVHAQHPSYRKPRAGTTGVWDL